jgi:hypothetical protein
MDSPSQLSPFEVSGLIFPRLGIVVALTRMDDRKRDGEAKAMRNVAASPQLSGCERIDGAWARGRSGKIPVSDG